MCQFSKSIFQHHKSDNLTKALDSLKKGGGILIGDKESREDEVDFVFSAYYSTPELVNISITHAKGLLCVAMSSAWSAQMNIPRAPDFEGPTAFCLSLDSRKGITSGISAQDRSLTIQLLSEGSHEFQKDFISPGHVFPVEAHPQGLRSRHGHTEAVVTLCEEAYLPPVGAMCEILQEDGSPLRPKDIKSHPYWSQYPFISIEELLSLLS
jgi:3,4-dihydroxy 2-butanone 4-phosphate synthase / GTP cyclohydrolase II